MNQRPAYLSQPPSIPSMSRARSPLPCDNHVIKKRILWIDGVGGYSLIDHAEIVIGQAMGNSDCDVCIVGDLSRQAGAVLRAEGDYLLQPLQATCLNGGLIDRAHLLRDGDTLQFGPRVKLGFRKPNPLSATACLSLLGLGRFRPSVDGVLLLADSCILGPHRSSHVQCPDWNSELLLRRQASGWFFRGPRVLEVNGKLIDEPFPLQAGLRIRGEDCSLSIE